jgi:hypothetical protein
LKRDQAEKLLFLRLRIYYHLKETKSEVEVLRHLFNQTLALAQIYAEVVSEVGIGGSNPSVAPPGDLLLTVDRSAVSISKMKQLKFTCLLVTSNHTSIVIVERSLIS